MNQRHSLIPKWNGFVPIFAHPTQRLLLHNSERPGEVTILKC